MKKLFLLWVAMLVALAALSGAAPSANGGRLAAVSPIATPQLTPPFRATPTGWPKAPFSWEERERQEKEQKEPEVFPIGVLYWRWLISR
jgi:hypothetical protein